MNLNGRTDQRISYTIQTWTINEGTNYKKINMGMLLRFLFLPDYSGFELIDILQDSNFRHCLKINWNCFYKKSPQRLATLHKSIMQWEYKIGNMSSHPIGFLYFLILDVGCLLAKLRFLVSEFTIALSYLFEFFQHNQYRAYSNMNEYIYLRLRNLFRREKCKIFRWNSIKHLKFSICMAWFHFVPRMCKGWWQRSILDSKEPNLLRWELIPVSWVCIYH